MLGALVGDAAGAVLEFLDRTPSADEISHAMSMPGGGVYELAPGQITDDGEMAIALASAMAAHGGKYVAKTVAMAYVDWAESNPFDIGMATRQAFAHGRSGRNLVSICQQEALNFNTNSQANGALMRVMPLGVAAAGWSEKDAVKWASFDASLSHPHETCQIANAAYVLALRHLVLKPKDMAGAIEGAHTYLSATQSEVGQWLDDALAERLPDAQIQMGFVRHGFTRAFFHLHQGSDFAVAISHTLAAGGDTDTNACIVGGLLGAYWGAGHLMQDPSIEKMLREVLACDTRGGQLRPERFHSARMLGHLGAFRSQSC